MLWMVDRSGTVRMANARTEEVLGYPPASLEGKRMDDLLGGSEKNEIVVLLRGLEEGSEMPEVEAEVRTPEDRTVPMMLDVSEVEVSGEPHFLVRMRDLREIKGLEQEYRDLFDGIANAVFIGNPDNGQIYQANEPALELTGRTVGEMMGQEYDAEHPESWETIAGLMDGGELSGYETQLKREVGDDVPVEIHIRLVPRGDYCIDIESALDLTQRSVLEDCLQ